MTQSVMDRLLTAGLCGNTLGQDIQTLTIHFLNFNLWINIVILDLNLYFILYFTVFYDCFVQHFGQCKLNLNVLYK